MVDKFHGKKKSYDDVRHVLMEVELPNLVNYVLIMIVIKLYLGK